MRSRRRSWPTCGSTSTTSTRNRCSDSPGLFEGAARTAISVTAGGVPQISRSRDPAAGSPRRAGGGATGDVEGRCGRGREEREEGGSASRFWPPAEFNPQLNIMIIIGGAGERGVFCESGSGGILGLKPGRRRRSLRDDLIPGVVRMLFGSGRGRGAHPGEDAGPLDVCWHVADAGQIHGFAVGHLEGLADVGHGDAGVRIDVMEGLVEPGDRGHAVLCEVHRGTPVEVVAQIRVVVPHANEAHGGTGCRPQPGEDGRQLFVDEIQAPRRQASLTIWKATQRSMSLKPRSMVTSTVVGWARRKATASAIWVCPARPTAVSPTHKSPGGLPRASELDQLQAMPAGPFNAQEVVGVARVGGLAVRSGGGGLEADGGGSAQVQVVLDRCRRCRCPGGGRRRGRSAAQGGEGSQARTGRGSWRPR